MAAILVTPLLLLGFLNGAATGDGGADSNTVAPQGHGQLRTAPTLFQGGLDRSGNPFLLNGQPAQDGKLVLTASNGFFDHGTCRAGGESDLPKFGDEALIKPNFAYLDHWKSTSGTIRWHCWIANPGTVRLNVCMRVSPAEAGSQLKVSFAGTSRLVTTVQSEPDTPQPWGLAFNVEQPGEHTVSFAATQIADANRGVGQLHTIDAFGTAIEGSQLLRARWRPAAVHGSYSCSKVPQSRMWVMTTRSTCDFSSYSPITTPFGYFGTSFEADRRTKGSFNFSMWAAGSGKAVPPLEEMPHLLAAGSREAEFSGFGHEGSGVKLRQWIPMPDRPELCIQALRVESDGNYDTYHGYFWDHPTRQWKLYAVGRKWNDGRSRMNLTPGSFCEIPGPPHLQRSGDQVREVRRRGWAFKEDGTWHAMDTFHCKSKTASNKDWYTTVDGEFAMRTGGMRYHPFKQPDAPIQQRSLPEFLSPESTRQLHELPAEVSGIRVTRVERSTAEIILSVPQAGTNATVEIYYGESDCLTFAKRNLHGTERNSLVSQSTQADNRSWAYSTGPLPLKSGDNLIKLDHLKPGKTFYFRALIINDEGKLWTFQTEALKTRTLDG